MNKRLSRRPLAEINIVPYVDVMLVLLVIFMITTPLLNQGVKVDLPQAKARAISSKQRPPLIVTVDAEGRYYLNVTKKPQQAVNQLVLLNRVTAELRYDQQTGQKRQVFIRADQNVNYGQVMRAMVLTQKAGAASVGLITEPSGAAHVG